MKARIRLTWQESLFNVVVASVTISGTALVLIVGAAKVMSGTLTVGSLLVVIAYLQSVYGPLARSRTPPARCSKRSPARAGCGAFSR